MLVTIMEKLNRDNNVDNIVDIELRTQNSEFYLT